jgi:hypothetical protein
MQPLAWPARHLYCDIQAMYLSNRLCKHKLGSRLLYHAQGRDRQCFFFPDYPPVQAPSASGVMLPKLLSGFQWNLERLEPRHLDCLYTNTVIGT